MMKRLDVKRDMEPGEVREWIAQARAYSSKWKEMVIHGVPDELSRVERLEVSGLSKIAVLYEKTSSAETVMVTPGKDGGVQTKIDMGKFTPRRYRYENLPPDSKFHKCLDPITLHEPGVISVKRQMLARTSDGVVNRMRSAGYKPEKGYEKNLWSRLFTLDPDGTVAFTTPMEGEMPLKYSTRGRLIEVRTCDEVYMEGNVDHFGPQSHDSVIEIQNCTNVVLNNLNMYNNNGSALKVSRVVGIDVQGLNIWGAGHRGLNWYNVVNLNMNDTHMREIGINGAAVGMLVWYVGNKIHHLKNAVITSYKAHNCPTTGLWLDLGAESVRIYKLTASNCYRGLFIEGCPGPNSIMNAVFSECYIGIKSQADHLRCKNLHFSGCGIPINLIPSVRSYQSVWDNSTRDVRNTDNNDLVHLKDKVIQAIQ